ncbi:MAG: flagellar basal-body rod protein FlgC [Actinomycetota bacterium]|nr:flagellar basal-body rod protein FlgC [Actinomycetota bacterium]
MSLFGAMPIARSGIDVAQTWIDAIGGNIANANDAVSPNQGAYATQYVVAQPLPSTQPSGAGQGVVASQVLLGSTAGQLAYQPNNPLANAQGMVRYPSVDLGQQLVDLVMAQTSYQANVAVVNQAKAAYQSALTLGS